MIALRGGAPKKPLLQRQEVLKLILHLDEELGLDHLQNAQRILMYDPSAWS